MAVLGCNGLRCIINIILSKDFCFRWWQILASLHQVQERGIVHLLAHWLLMQPSPGFFAEVVTVVRPEGLWYCSANIHVRVSMFLYQYLQIMQPITRVGAGPWHICDCFSEWVSVMVTLSAAPPKINHNWPVSLALHMGCYNERAVSHNCFYYTSKPEWAIPDDNKRAAHWQASRQSPLPDTNSDSQYTLASSLQQ